MHATQATALAVAWEASRAASPVGNAAPSCRAGAPCHRLGLIAVAPARASLVTAVVVVVVSVDLLVIAVAQHGDGDLLERRQAWGGQLVKLLGADRPLRVVEGGGADQRRDSSTTEGGYM